jgi:serine/threonine protein kinase
MSPIGSGGAGVVWRAHDELLDREVAVKEIARLFGVSDAERAESYERTLREARAAARISHPGVAAVYDVVSEDGCPYIVMELIHGCPLSQVITEEGPLSRPRVADIGRQVLAALMAGHAVGVMHRDLKPANVLITPDGRAVLTDFGIASVAGDPSITQTGVVLGTPGYLAPERAKGEMTTPAADLWSLGATLYAAVSGQGPYEGYDGAIATMFAIITADPPALDGGGPVCDIIGALMNRDPRQRPGAAETARALDAAAGPAELSPLSSPPPPAQPPQAQPQLRPPPPPRQPLRPEPAPTVTSETLRPGRSPQTDLNTGLLAGSPPAVEGQARSTVRGTLKAHRPPARPSRRPGRRPGRGIRWPGVVAGAGVIVVVGLILTATVFRPGRPAAQVAALTVAPAVTQQFRVAAVTDSSGATEVFGRAKDGALRVDVLSNGAPSGWTDLPGGRDFTGVPAVAASQGGQLDVFARTTTGQLDHIWQTKPSGPWQGPKTLSAATGTASAITSDPAVISWPDGHLEVFARLADRTLGTASQRSDRSWSGWTSLGGKLGSPPVAALDSTGHPQVFALDQAGQLTNDYYLNGSWAGMRRLPGDKTAAYTGTPAVGTNFDKRLEVFVRTKAGPLVHVWQTPQDLLTWGGPIALIDKVASDPAVIELNNGTLMDVFAMGPGADTVHTSQTQAKAGTPWSQPESLHGTGVGAPTAILAGNTEELFAAGTDRAIGYDHLTSQGWSGWSSLHGSF